MEVLFLFFALRAGLKLLGAIGLVSVYIMRYVQEESLRLRVQVQLNRGESRHDLAR
jgi:TnpA family transposase